MQRRERTVVVVREALPPVQLKCVVRRHVGASTAEDTANRLAERAGEGLRFDHV